MRLTSPRQRAVSTHGTGCTLASAITAGLARGMELPDAIVLAKIYVNRGLRTGNAFSLGHASWPEGLLPSDLPWLGERTLRFPSCGDEPLGFYPIVDRAAWLERLLPLGVKTVQLRIKDLKGAELDREIARAVALARKFNARLFVNDYWELALKHRAYGVHLGQEDLDGADLASLVASETRLGVSTHSLRELARARALRPSYVALGPIYPTILKAMRFAPQGIETLELWRALVDVPLVAIGGLSLERAVPLRRLADGFAVVTDLSSAPDPVARAMEWLNSR
jgi:hydroxymethylpyrimidine kinase/phosphomethylpyrimidine kinase/thiamine-phosphate diphosphorylase